MNKAWNAATDVVLALYPIGIVYKLRMPMKLKFGLCILMGIGIFTAVCSIIKTYEFKDVEASTDPLCKNFANYQSLSQANNHYRRPLTPHPLGSGRNVGHPHHRQRSSTLAIGTLRRRACGDLLFTAQPLFHSAQVSTLETWRLRLGYGSQ